MSSSLSSAGTTDKLAETIDAAFERREKLQSFNPHSSFDIMPGAGHWVQYESHEPFNRRMREVLNGSE